MTVWVRLAALVALLLAGLVVVAFVPLPDVAEIRDRVTAAGPMGPVVFAGLYVVATLLVLPKNVLTAGAGAVFGLAAGVGLVWVAAMVGAAAAFWLGRLLGREGVSRLAGHHLARLDALVLRHGVLAVLVLRLVPLVPFTAVNYGSGVTAVPFAAYLLATAVGIVPGTVAYVALGAYGGEPTGWPFLLAAGALLTLSVAGWWVARRRRGQHRAQAPTGTPPPAEPASPSGAG